MGNNDYRNIATGSTDISVCCCPEWQQEAERIAQRFNLNLTAEQCQSRFCLYLSKKGLELYYSEDRPYGSTFIDFTAGRARHRRLFGGGKRQPLARAIGIKGSQRPQVLDCTAGFARDAFVMSCLGCEVTMTERSPVIAALLTDALHRASLHKETKDIVSRMTLQFTDGLHYLASLSAADYPDTIYIDPMYPHRTKSALVKKEMVIARELVGDDKDAESLLEHSLAKTRDRVVVKRPRLAPTLGKLLPSTAIYSKNTRYDLYFTK